MGGADGGWCDWSWWRWWQRWWGCRLLVGLPSAVFWLVLVMVSPVVQMVGGVGDAVVVRGGGGGGKGDSYPGGLWGCCGYQSMVLLSVVFLRAVRLLAGSVVGDALVLSACGSWL